MDLTELHRRMIPALSPQQRAAVEAVYLRELTQEEAAAELGVNRNTLSAQLIEARARLAALVARFYPESQR